MLFKKKEVVKIIFLIPFLFSCSRFSKGVERGYNYDSFLRSIMVGIRITEINQSLDEPIEIELGYGHPSNMSEPSRPANYNIPGPICIYIDNHYDKDNNEVNLLDYRYIESSWNYVSEMPSEEFWSDNYTFENDFFKGKTFKHTETFYIDPSYFITEKFENMGSFSMTIYVSMVWQNEEDKTWKSSMAYGYVSLGYKVNDNIVEFI